MLIEKFKALPRICLATVVVVAAGCANLGIGPDLPPQDAVRLRAQAWADAVMAGDYEKAWEYTSPSYRQFSSAKDYTSLVQGSARWDGATVDSVTCTEDVCDVGLMIEYEIKRIKLHNTRSLPYKWVLSDGQWWLYVPAK